MKIYEIKDIEQKKALNNWAINGFRGSIIAGTGFGKSRCGVMAVNYALTKLNKKSALVLVPTTQLKAQFVDEFHKWGYENCLDRVEVMCYQSAYKLKGNHYDIVICDEVHLGLSDKYRLFFKNNTYNQILCMTATLPEEPQYKVRLYALAPTIYEISLDECVEKGLVAPYKVFCMPLSLTDEEQTAYTVANRKFVHHKMALGEDAFTAAKYYIGNGSPTMRGHAAGFYAGMRERKAIVDKAFNKIGAFKELVHNNLDKRIISFGGVNSFTDVLAESVSPLAEVYHSKRSTKQKRVALQRFKDGEVNVLCSTKALNQGFDVPNANMGIICGLTSKGLSMIQRVGRLIRFEEGKIGEVYILYIKDSQEEKWLTNAVQDFKGVVWL